MKFLSQKNLLRQLIIQNHKWNSRRKILFPKTTSLPSIGSRSNNQISNSLNNNRKTLKLLTNLKASHKHSNKSTKISWQKRGNSAIFLNKKNNLCKNSSISTNQFRYPSNNQTLWNMIKKIHKIFFTAFLRINMKEIPMKTKTSNLTKIRILIMLLPMKSQ